tara:strand:+ start:39 stop:365 length:327 start_codon:yes stop_codon:yes gene_type:complete
MWVILRVAGPAGRKAFHYLVKEGSKKYKEWMAKRGKYDVEVLARNREKGPLEGQMPGASSGRATGASDVRPGQTGKRPDVLPPRNKGGVIRSTKKQGSKKPITRRRKK